MKIITTGFLPVRKHAYDAGADVFSPVEFTLEPNETKAIDLQLSVEVHPGQMALLMPRSSIGKMGVHTHMAPIDAGYNGSIHAILTNCSKVPVTFKKYDRIAQLVYIPILLPEFVSASEAYLKDEFEPRNDGAFGSTGR